MGKMAEMLDDIDREIINELQKNPYIDMEDLRDIVNNNLNRRLSISTIYHRKGKLIEGGILKEAFIPDYNKIGKATLCFIAIKFDGHDERILEEFTKIPNVMEAHAIGGQYDVFLKVRGRDIREIANLVFRIRSDYSIVKTTEIFVVLKTEKETQSIEI